jgi:hypothetical protein
VSSWRDLRPELRPETLTLTEKQLGGLDSGEAVERWWVEKSEGLACRIS